MIKMDNVYVKTNDKMIINGFTLTINSGEIHVIMGPNGSGKSTLSQAIIGNEAYPVVKGSITYKNKNLLSMPAFQRARDGIFLLYQNPVEVPGLLFSTFMREAVNARRAHLKHPPVDRLAFVKQLKEAAKYCHVPESFISRPLGMGMSGGEKKRLEILQMYLLQPDFIILDELDSGLDVDALKEVATVVNELFNGDRAIMLITHYPRILQYIIPNKVHILQQGRIVQSGDIQLAKEIENRGYHTE